VSASNAFHFQIVRQVEIPQEILGLGLENGRKSGPGGKDSGPMRDLGKSDP
jgi:hypothetical protein